MLKRINLTQPVALLALLLAAFSATSLAMPARARWFRLSSASLRAAAANDKEQDGLAGPVRRVRTETAKLSPKEGKLVEGARQVLETATYDIKGNKIDNAYFLAAGGTLTGKESYKYDDKGNITEMTLSNPDGTLQSKEVYSYEFDSFGNWTKMTTSVAVFEGGKVTYEPTEITYRVIAYYLEESTMAKMTQAAAPAANNAQPAAPAGNNASSTSTSAPAVAANNVAATSKTAPAPTGSSTANNSTPNSHSTAANSLTANAKPAAASSSPASAPSTTSSSALSTTPAAASQANKNAPAPIPSGVVAPDKTKLYAVANPSSGNASSGGSSSSSNSAPVVKDESEAPSRPVAKAPLKPVSGGVLNGKAVSLPAPIYPTAAKAARAAGIVTVEVVIDVTGKVISANASGGHIMLRQAAERAAMQARFSPTLLSGQPVKVSGVINYNFTFAQ